MAKSPKKKRGSAKGRQPGLFQRLDTLFHRMEEEYAAVAEDAGLTCADCPDNCCVSYFQHHTVIEWAWLWRGMNELSDEKREEYLSRAQETVQQYRAMLASGIRPKVMCPLNDQGRCGLYGHRLMICRMHGTSHRFSRPDGTEMQAPGCFRFMANVEGREDVPTLDRTPLYRELAELEMEYRRERNLPPMGAGLTIAEMLVAGPPRRR